MSKAPTNFQVPADLREAAEKNVEQARKAVDNVLDAVRRTAEQMEGSFDEARGSASEAAGRTFSYTEQNINAAFDLAQRMVRAKTPQEAAEIQAEYMRQQFERLQSQMKELGSQQFGPKSRA